MKLFVVFFVSSLSTLASASAIAVDEAVPVGAAITAARTPALLSRTWWHWKPKKDNWGNALEQDRKKVTIRSSKNDYDDISHDFLWALKKANHGGLVYLEKGKKYMIGKKLDLTFLNDVYVKIDGELKVSSITATIRNGTSEPN
jgi:galacturan 1,4-alpha-galacturonidase